MRIALLIAALATPAAADTWTTCMNAHVYRTAEVGDDTIASGEYYGGGDVGDGKQRGARASFVARYDAKGALRWAYAIEGRVDIRDLAVSADGTVFVVGDAYEDLDFGAGSTKLVSDYQDAWIASISAGGKLRWAKRFGNAGSYNGLAELALTSDGVSAVAEVPLGTDFGGGPIGKRHGNDRQSLRVRFTRDGKLLDAVPAVVAHPKVVTNEAGEEPREIHISYADPSHHWETVFDDSGRGVFGRATLDPRGGVIAGGSFQYDLTLDAKHRLETAETAMFAVAYGNDGAIRWATTIPGKGWIDELAVGRQILVGGLADDSSAPPLPGTSTVTNELGEEHRGFIAALDDAGKVRWIRSLPARLLHLAVGAHTTMVYGHGAGTDNACLAHDLVLP